MLTCNAIDPELAMSYANMSSLERHVLWERFDSRPVKKNMLLSGWLHSNYLWVMPPGQFVAIHKL